MFPICYLGTEIFFFDLVKSLAIFSRYHKLFCFINNQPLQISSRWLCLTYILVSCCVTDVSVKNPPLIYWADSFKTPTSRSLIYSIYEISVDVSFLKNSTFSIFQTSSYQGFPLNFPCLNLDLWQKNMYIYGKNAEQKRQCLAPRIGVESGTFLLSRIGAVWDEPNDG